MGTIAFATCVQLGLSCIQEIYEIGGSLSLLLTLPDDRARNKSGRIYLDAFAAQHHVPLLKAENINDRKVVDALKNDEVDWLFIIGWSQIAGPELLAAPRCGCIGMHPTLLPEGRGRAAIPWAVLKGLAKTGVTLFCLDEGVDTGDIIGQGVIPLTGCTTATELYEQVERMHVTLIREYYPAIVSNRITRTKQDETKATVWLRRTPEDGEIFPDMSMEEAERMVRAVTHPYPGAFFRQGQTVVRIWSCETSPRAGRIRLRDGYLTPNEFEVERP